MTFNGVLIAKGGTSGMAPMRRPPTRVGLALAAIMVVSDERELAIVSEQSRYLTTVAAGWMLFISPSSELLGRHAISVTILMSSKGPLGLLEP